MVSDNNLRQVQRALPYEVINKGNEFNPTNTLHNVFAEKHPMFQWTHWTHYKYADGRTTDTCGTKKLANLICCFAYAISLYNSMVAKLTTIFVPANLLLQDTIERIHVGGKYGDIPRGIFLVRGENMVLVGEIVSDSYWRSQWCWWLCKAEAITFSIERLKELSTVFKKRKVYSALYNKRNRQILVKRVWHSVLSWTRDCWENLTETCSTSCSNYHSQIQDVRSLALYFTCQDRST